MHDAAASWLMTSLTDSPAMVALVQTATALPTFFLALAAGALADIVDRRRLLILGQGWMMLVAITLGVLTILGLTNAWILLILTFCMGIGLALSLPAISALLPDLVPRNELLPAITLNGVAGNATRAIGPALGGTLIGIVGPGLIFIINGLTYIGIIATLIRSPLKRDKESPLPSERFIGAVKVGVRYARQSSTLKKALLRGSLFFCGGVAVLALLPVFVRETLGGGPQTFGLMLTGYGAGAVLTAFVLPSLARIANRDQILIGGQTLFAASLVWLSYSTSISTALPATFLAGFAWLITLATYQVAVQMSLPTWVRARGLAIFLMTVMGFMALGSALWGLVARELSIPLSMIIAAIFIVTGTLFTMRLSLVGDEDDLSPVSTWSDPGVALPLEGHSGPVEVLVEYEIPPENRDKFVRQMRAIRRIRQRNGAYSWSLHEDINQPGVFIETFMDDSWHDHLRRRLRLTAADRAAQDSVNALQVVPGEPKVRQLLAEELPRSS